MNDLVNLVPVLGVSTGIVIVVYYFLQHNAEQSKLNREAMKEVMTRVEGMEVASREGIEKVTNRFEIVVAEFRKEQRQTVDQLVGLNRETVGAMAAVGQRVDGLGQQVTTLGQQVGMLGQQVVNLGGTVEKLTVGVGKLDQGGPHA